MSEGGAQEALRKSVRCMIRESGLKQSFIAKRLGITEKHLSQLLRSKVQFTIDWAERIVDVCRQPLRLDIEPRDWVQDVVTYRKRAEQLEVEIEHAKAALAGDNEGIRLWMLDCSNLVQKHRDRAVAAEVERDGLADVLVVLLDIHQGQKNHENLDRPGCNGCAMFREIKDLPSMQAAHTRCRERLLKAIESGDFMACPSLDDRLTDQGAGES